MKTANTLWRDLLRQVRLLPLAALFTALPLTAQVPSLINYQGRLTDAEGQPVTGNRTMAVRIYDAASGGNMTYEESVGTVAVGNGTYSFRFGSGGSVVVSVNETVATTNGTNQVFSGTLQGTPSNGTPRLSDGAYTLDGLGRFEQQRRLQCDLQWNGQEISSGLSLRSALGWSGDCGQL